MSSLGYQSDSVATPDRSCIRNPHGWQDFAISGTISITATMLADSDAEDLYLPNDFIPVGTLVALATGGTYSGLWVPYLPNSAAANGEDDAKGMVLEPAYVTRAQRGSVQETIVHASIVPAGIPCQIFASKMPQVNDHTAYLGGAGSSVAVATGDLPTGFINLDDFQINNLAGL